MGGLEAIQGNYSRLAVALESLTEEGLGGGDVTRSTEVGFDGFALFINGAVEVHPLTAYFKVGQSRPAKRSVPAPSAMGRRSPWIMPKS